MREHFLHFNFICLCLFGAFFANSIWSGQYVWVPENVETLQGIILQQNGTSASRSPIWTEYAKQKGFAIMDGGDHSQDLQATLNTHAQTTGHPELSNLFVCTFGGSRGGWWSMITADNNSARVLGVVAGHAGIWPRDAGVPTLFPIAEKDNNFYHPGKTIQKDIDEAFIPNRKKGALWGLPMIWDSTSHGTIDWEGFALIYFHRLIDYRFPENFSPKEEVPQLRNISENEGWLSSVPDSKNPFPKLYPFSEYPGDKSLASWMPDEYLSWVWRAYVSTQPDVAIINPQQVPQEGKSDLMVPLIMQSSMTLTAEKLNTSKEIIHVEFYDGNIRLGETTNEPYSISACLETGPHALIAIATDSEGKKTSSKPVMILVDSQAEKCETNSIHFENGGNEENKHVPNNSPNTKLRLGWESLWHSNMATMKYTDPTGRIIIPNYR